MSKVQIIYMMDDVAAYLDKEQNKSQTVNTILRKHYDALNKKQRVMEMSDAEVKEMQELLIEQKRIETRIKELWKKK